MMTRKDYVKIAKAVNNNSYGIGDGRYNLVNELCTIFEEDNPNFNPSIFKDACNKHLLV